MQFVVDRPLRQYRLAFLDLDGTLLNSAHDYSDYTLLVLQRLSSKGFKIGIATGRTVHSIKKYVEKLQLSHPVPFVAFNGALGGLISGSNVAEYVSLPLSLENSNLILDLANTMDLCAQYYDALSGDVYVIPPSTADKVDLLKQYASLTGKDQIIVSSYEEAQSKCLASKILILSTDVDALISAADKVLPPKTFQIIRGSPKPFFVEFLTYGVTKGSTAVQVCEALCCPVTELIAYGDGDNDKEMLAFAGLGVAMANAGSEAKGAADVILEFSNNEDGVARHLEQMESNGLLLYDY